MKKWMYLTLSALLAISLIGCGKTATETKAETQPAAETEAATDTKAEAGAEAEAEADTQTDVKTEDDTADFVWTREGYFTDEDDNFLSVTWMEEDVDEPGWYVGVMIGEYWGGATVQLEGNALHGNLSVWDEDAEPYIVTVTEEGENGLQMVVEGGETYHFTEVEVPDATIVVTINTEGYGYIDYAEGEEAPEIDPDFPAQSAYIGLAEPTVHTFVAAPGEGYEFVKWTKNGEDFSTESQITLMLDESADYIAVFEDPSITEDEDTE